MKAIWILALNLVMIDAGVFFEDDLGHGVGPGEQRGSQPADDAQVPLQPDGAADEGVGDPAMVLESGDRPAEVSDDVQVSGLGGEHARSGCVQRALVQPRRPADARTGKEMGQWFQANKITVTPRM